MQHGPGKGDDAFKRCPCCPCCQRSVAWEACNAKAKARAKRGSRRRRGGAGKLRIWNNEPPYGVGLFGRVNCDSSDRAVSEVLSTFFFYGASAQGCGRPAVLLIAWYVSCVCACVYVCVCSGWTPACMYVCAQGQASKTAVLGAFGVSPSPMPSPRVFSHSPLLLPAAFSPPEI